jgi:hypothetical protein
MLIVLPHAEGDVTAALPCSPFARFLFPPCAPNACFRSELQFVGRRP